MLTAVAVASVQSSHRRDGPPQTPSITDEDGTGGLRRRLAIVPGFSRSNYDTKEEYDAAARKIGADLMAGRKAVVPRRRKRQRGPLPGTTSSRVAGYYRHAKEKQLAKLRKAKMQRRKGKKSRPSQTD